MLDNITIYYYGQLGNGTTTDSNVPVSVDNSLYAFMPNKLYKEKILVADKSADYNLCDKSHHYKPFRVDDIFKDKSLSYENYFLAFADINISKNKLWEELWF